VPEDRLGANGPQLAGASTQVRFRESAGLRCPALLTYLKAYEYVAEARQDITAYFEFYNHHGCIRRWLSTARARSLTKRRDLQVRRGEKTLARAPNTASTNKMQTWAGFSTLRSPDRCLEDGVHHKIR